MAREGDSLWNDMTTWLMSVYDAGTVERPIVSRTPEKKKKGHKG